MKNKIITAIAIVLLFVCSSIIVSAAEAVGEQNQKRQMMPENNGGNQFIRLRNRICDTIGICLGGCNLTEITGTFEYDEINFFIGDVELHFGPNWYITAAIASEDYDNDGENELVIDELLGLVGTEVTVEGHLQSDDWMSVFTINGIVYREPGQPIWASQHQWHWRNRHNQL
jgi:hypothetical protein